MNLTITTPDFAQQIAEASQRLAIRARAVHVAASNLAFESIVDGSALTGAPGQPVVSGKLRDSWTLTRPADNVAEIASDSPYAPRVEHNFDKRVYVNHGVHSVDLTIGGWDRIVAAAVESVPERGP